MGTVEVRSNWEQLPGTAAGGYYRIAPNVILAIPQPGFVQDEASARASLEAFDSIAYAAHHKQSIVVLVDRVASQDSPARRVWATPRADETRCAQALVCGTMLARAIGSFFLGLNKAAIPTRIFADVDAAAAWAQAMANEHGAEL